MPAGLGRAFWTVGFPEGQDRGVEAEGDLRAATEFGRIMARGDARPGGFFIEGGFSGAPLIDRGSGSVVGMAVEATYDPARRTAFVVPVEQLELAWPPLARPYKGLGTFQETDTRFFFGRSRYEAELATKLARLPLVAVVGRSGCGKSSLVRAGLVPRLRNEANWCVVTFRPGAPSDDPFRNLAAALLEETVGPVRDPAEAVRRPGRGRGDGDGRIEDAPTSLVPILRAMPMPRRPEIRKVLLVADQFEELFTLVADPAEANPERSLPRASCDASWARLTTVKVWHQRGVCLLCAPTTWAVRSACSGSPDALKDAET